MTLLTKTDITDIIWQYFLFNYWNCMWRIRFTDRLWLLCLPTLTQRRDIRHHRRTKKL